MHETELKFQVPAAATAAVQRAVATASARTTRLRARYFDTADGRLAAAGVALRLRLEGRRWVQTLKGPGDGLAVRLEHEVPLPAGIPLPDLARHAGTPAADMLWASLGAKPGGEAPALQVVFETDIQRTQRLLRVAGAQVELALDVGTISAGGRRLPVCELEFELLRGPLQALGGVATRWVRRHGLWLDVRTKADRGELLARDLTVRPATGLQPARLQADMTVDQGLRSLVTAALAQALPNLAALAGGVGQPEHLHQLRVGLRRLRSVLRLFGGGHTAMDASWDADLAHLFRRLGDARDRDVLADTLLPALQAAGGPPLTLAPAAAGMDVAAVLREPETVALLLSLLVYGGGEPAAAMAQAVAGDGLKQRAGTALRELDRRAARQARRLLEIDDGQRHRLRRQVKRLRYGVEATASLWPAKPCGRYLRQLRRLQETLGAYTDVQMAQAWIAQQDSAGPAAWFARGWLAARHDETLAAAATALQDWPRPPKAWRPR